MFGSLGSESYVKSELFFHVPLAGLRDDCFVVLMWSLAPLGQLLRFDFNFNTTWQI